MLRHICVVTLLVLVQRCGAQPPCDGNDKTKCTPALNTVEKCTNDKCECVPGYSPNAAKCELIQPKISGETADKKYFVGSSYSFVCNTNATGTLAFEWSKDGQPAETKKTLTINDAKTTDSGSYKCKFTVGAVNQESAPIIVAVVAPGKECTIDGDCKDSVFSGVCDQTAPKRCICAANHVKKEGTCENGAAVAHTSLLLLGVTIFSQLMNLS